MPFWKKSRKGETDPQPPADGTDQSPLGLAEDPGQDAAPEILDADEHAPVERAEEPLEAAHPNEPPGEPESDIDVPAGFHKPNVDADAGLPETRGDAADASTDFDAGGDDVRRESAIHVPEYDFPLPDDPGASTQQPNDALAADDAASVDDGRAGPDALASSDDTMHEAAAEDALDGSDSGTDASSAEAQTDESSGDAPEDDAPKRRRGLRLGSFKDHGDTGGTSRLASLSARLDKHLGGRLSAGLDKLGLGKQDADAESAADADAEDEAPEPTADSDVHELEQIVPDERYKEVETYPIHPPYAYVRVMFDEEHKDYIYQLLEPELSPTEREILAFIEETLVDMLTVSPEEIADANEAEFITDRFNDVIFDYSIILHEDEGEEEAIKRKLLYYVHRDFIGHGPIDVVMSDPYIEDISCDGPDVPVFLYHRKYESMRSTVIFHGHDVLDSYVIKMAQRSGKHISIAEPILDATMTDGSRLQSTLGKEVSAGGSTFTIRKFRPDPFTPPDLVLFRTMSAEMLAYLWIAVQHGGSIMYAGGTASGKTTSLNAILLFIPPQMKIVSIEDTREVNLPHENWIAGITRTGFGPRDQYGRQAGEIDMFQLLKNALRQRPEYIIVGEVRGQEAYSLFQAMATGHAAYGTMHADSVDAVIHRLESDPINVPRTLLEALDVVSVQIQTRVGGKRVRRTKQISEIVGIDPHTREILTNEVFRWVPKDDSFKFSGVSYVLERIQIEKGLPQGAMLEELKRRSLIIRWMIEHRIQNYKEVSKLVSGYYRDPESVMRLVSGEMTPEEVPPGLREIAAREFPELAAHLAADEAADEATGTASAGEDLEHAVDAEPTETDAGIDVAPTVDDEAPVAEAPQRLDAATSVSTEVPTTAMGHLGDAIAEAALEHVDEGRDAWPEPASEPIADDAAVHTPQHDPGSDQPADPTQYTDAPAPSVHDDLDALVDELTGAPPADDTEDTNADQAAADAVASAFDDAAEDRVDAVREASSERDERLVEHAAQQSGADDPDHVVEAPTKQRNSESEGKADGGDQEA